MQRTSRTLVKWVGAVSLAAGLIAAAPAVTFAKHLAPRPRLFSRSWQIKFVWHTPTRLFYMSGAGNQMQLRKYWYLTYTIMNQTHRDLYFTPSFQLRLDNGRLISPVVGVTPLLCRAVKRATGNPFLIDPDMVSGKLLQGADNAKDSFAIFSRVPSGIRGFKIFITGLSGETAIQKDPLNGKPVVLHKTLVLDYHIPGHAINIAPQPILVKKYWVMR
ncbi:MAG: hypothetical protein ACP5O1_06065 [Phycisphaerae bacterium]